jgi:hypothetical protein
MTIRDRLAWLRTWDRDDLLALAARALCVKCGRRQRFERYDGTLATDCLDCKGYGMRPVAPACSQAGCEEAAVSRYWWPGKGVMLACAVHAAKAVAVGDALGMSILLEPLAGGTEGA